MCLDWVHRGVEAAQEESLGSRERVAKSKVLGFAAIDAGQSDPMLGGGKGASFQMSQRQHLLCRSEDSGLVHDISSLSWRCTITGEIKCMGMRRSPLGQGN